MKESLAILIVAAVRASEKLKAEYDRGCPDEHPAPDESWAEGEALWHALAVFGYGRFSNASYTPTEPELP